MVAKSWKRPSVIVVLSSAVVIAVAVARGDLRVESAPALCTTAANGAAMPRRSGEPVVVKPERGARSPVEEAIVHGRVLDSRGFLVVGAEVSSARGQPVVRTDADGEFKATVLADGSTNLLVRYQGHRGCWINPSPCSPDPLLVRLGPVAPWDHEPPEPARAPAALTGEGIVRNAAGKPLVGAYVKAAGTDVWSRTDDIGRYVLPLPGSTATLVVHHPGSTGDSGFAARSEPLTFDRSSGVVPLPELVAAAGSQIRGTLRDSRGIPVGGVPVQVRGEGLARVFESNVSGAFRIAGLLPGRYEIRAFAFRGAIGVRQEVALDRPVVDCELQMQNLVERRLRVLDESGSPVRRAYVASAVDGARQSVAQADAEGWAAVCVAPGDVQFEVRRADGGTAMSVRRYESEQALLVVAAP
jgi:hypothetical protein